MEERVLKLRCSSLIHVCSWSLGMLSCWVGLLLDPLDLLSISRFTLKLRL